MKYRLNGKIAFITGSTKSIGLAIAKKFCEAGATVILSGRFSKELGCELANKIHAHDYFELDVTSLAEWKSVMEKIEAVYGRLDILVNNAGIEVPAGVKNRMNIEDCSAADWEQVHAVNSTGVYYGCQTALPLLKKSSAASIINVGSRSGLVGVENIAYASSKSAVINLTKSIAVYCGIKSYPIRCNIIVPGAILTSMWDADFGKGADREARMKEYTKNIPLQKMGTPKDVAMLAVYLGANESRFVTGTTYLIDGGAMAALGSYSRFFDTSPQVVAPTVTQDSVPRAKL